MVDFRNAACFGARGRDLAASRNRWWILTSSGMLSIGALLAYLEHGGRRLGADFGRIGWDSEFAWLELRRFTIGCTFLVQLKTVFWAF